MTITIAKNLIKTPLDRRAAANKRSIGEIISIESKEYSIALREAKRSDPNLKKAFDLLKVAAKKMTLVLRALYQAGIIVEHLLRGIYRLAMRFAKRAANL